MIKRMHTIFCVLIVLTSLNQVTTAQEVAFNDTNLESAIRMTLEISLETTITQQLLQQELITLNAREAEITDLSGLEHATNLTRLSLNTNKISDLSPLSELTKLVSLSLNSNEISDLKPLEGLTNLTTLRLNENNIQRLVPLSKLTKLVELHLDSNDIKIVGPLRGLIELEELYLRENRIENINQLTTLANLEVLDISDNPIADVTQVHQLIASGVDVEFDSPVPHESQIAQTNVLFNEIHNASDDKNDWIELRNISGRDIPLNDWEISILTREGGTDNEETDIVEFPDYTLPADGVLLITNTDPSETTLLRGLNIRTPDIRTGAQHHYLVSQELILPNTHYLLYLRSARHSNETLKDIEDVAGTYFHDKLTADQPLTQGAAWQRTAIAQIGYAVEAWGESGYQGGIGYEPTAPEDTSPGTPGYHNSALATDFRRGQISISEVMFTNKIGYRTLPQWIELYNNSLTEAVNLNGWKITYEYRDGRQNKSDEKTLQKLVILPKQTVVIVSETSESKRNIPDRRVYDLFAIPFGDFQIPSKGQYFLASDGLFVRLSTPNGVDTDIVGNLDGDSHTQDTPLWELPSGTTENGARISMLRRYHHQTRNPLAGTEISSWRSATDAKLGKSTYYGDRTDVGNPGYTHGGVLPVSLSSFQAEQTAEGVVIKWTTESEVDNAGFFIYRIETKDGEFKVVNPTMIQGAGTTAERNEYRWTDTTAKPNTVYYYRIEDVSYAGEREQLATVRMKGLVSATGKLTTSWADWKVP